MSPFLEPFPLNYNKFQNPYAITSYVSIKRYINASCTGDHKAYFSGGSQYPNYYTTLLIKVTQA